MEGQIYLITRVIIVASGSCLSPFLNLSNATLVNTFLHPLLYKYTIQFWKIHVKEGIIFFHAHIHNPLT